MIPVLFGGTTSRREGNQDYLLPPTVQCPDLNQSYFDHGGDDGDYTKNVSIVTDVPSIATGKCTGTVLEQTRPDQTRPLRPASTPDAVSHKDARR